MKILTALLLASITAAHARAASPAAAGEVDGKKIFAKCVTCHGRDAKGNPAMAKMFKVDRSSMDLVGAAIRLPDAELAKMVVDGRGKQMPAFKGQLNDAEISAVLGYIRSLASAPAAPETSKTAEPKGLAALIRAARTPSAPPADAGEVDGQRIFAKCASCHGKDAKGNPVMAKLFKVDLNSMNLASAAAKLTDDEFAKIVVYGRGEKMPAFRGKLEDAEISAVLGYIRALAFAPAAPVEVDGKKIFAQCAACHGNDAKGTPVLAKMFKVDQSSLNLVSASAQLTDADLARMVVDGRGKKMPAFKGQLKDAEISAVLRYIRSLAAVPAAAADGKK